MLMTIVCSQFESVPVGAYRAKFVELSRCETMNGNAYRWKFEIIEGEHAGRIVSELSDADSPPTVKNKTGRFLAALATKSLAAGLQVDPESYIGKSYLVIVEPKEGGKTKISTFTAI